MKNNDYKKDFSFQKEKSDFEERYKIDFKGVKCSLRVRDGNILYAEFRGKNIPIKGRNKSDFYKIGANTIGFTTENWVREEGADGEIVYRENVTRKTMSMALNKVYGKEISIEVMDSVQKTENANLSIQKRKLTFWF